MSKFSKLIQKQKDQSLPKKHRFNLEAKTNANREGVLCPCGSKQSFKVCCEPIHKNISLAKTPLALMKSRYTAYVMGNIDYLMQSHHSSTRPIAEKDEILAWTNSVNWLRLEIIEAKEAQEEEEEGFVTFKAYFLESGIGNSIFEKSRFIKENNHWTYVDGIHS
ncbi:Sec-C motif domain protein [Wenyingzhuangia fucanilytica]|uniref:Sec-C motif domain protein n=1 Tax=Wenyingzhuangia fucanilytica TaxID=1790137 RepID=A0A1B1Y5D7_9FLAO|nr:YchJ family metal-binding protein [Wenyingzhuangia fucanilytica]ANW95959.1 Sec-C motif domain protein [Wenyingzhuangia fucanilytica]